MLKSARVLAKVQRVPTKCLTLEQSFDEKEALFKRAARMILGPHFRLQVIFIYLDDKKGCEAGVKKFFLDDRTVDIFQNVCARKETLYNTRWK